MTKAEDRRAQAHAEELLLLVPQLATGFKTLIGGAPRAGFPVSPRHLAMLISLSTAGPASISDVAARMKLSLTHASQIVGELATSGLVERREDDHDRRRTIVAVAAASQELIEGVKVGAARPLREFCASLPAAEAAQFVAHLARLVTCLTDTSGGSDQAGQAAAQSGVS